MRDQGLDLLRLPLSRLTGPMAAAFLLVPAQAIVGEFLKTFAEFPPRQKAASFSIDQVMEKAEQAQKSMAAGAGGMAK